MGSEASFYAWSGHFGVSAKAGHHGDVNVWWNRAACLVAAENAGGKGRARARAHASSSGAPSIPSNY